MSKPDPLTENPHGNGWDAFHAGVKLSDNPHRERDPEQAWRMWRLGWLAAENASEAAREREARNK